MGYLPSFISCFFNYDDFLVLQQIFRLFELPLITRVLIGPFLIMFYCQDSARIWMLSGGTRDCSELEKIPGIRVVTQLSLFGHNARIWDCYISDSVRLYYKMQMHPQFSISFRILLIVSHFILGSMHFFVGFCDPNIMMYRFIYLSLLLFLIRPWELLMLLV